MKESVRAELDMWVEDPQFIELFELILNQGASANSFIQQLLEWASKFIDPKQRQLRLQAFAVVNRLPLWAPRTKNAILMRAYRNSPTNTFCPNPEHSWRNSEASDIEKLEHLLFFYQKTCKYVLDKEDAVTAMAFQSNVSIAVADAYYTKTSKNI